MFDFVEEALDEIAFAVEREIAEALDDAVCFRRDDGFGATGFDETDNDFAVIAFVGQHVFCGDILQEQFCLGAIGGVSGSEDEAQRIAQGVAQCMQLGGQSAA